MYRSDKFSMAHDICAYNIVGDCKQKQCKFRHVNYDELKGLVHEATTTLNSSPKVPEPCSIPLDKAQVHSVSSQGLLDGEEHNYDSIVDDSIVDANQPNEARQPRPASEEVCGDKGSKQFDHLMPQPESNVEVQKMSSDASRRKRLHEWIEQVKDSSCSQDSPSSPKQQAVDERPQMSSSSILKPLPPGWKLKKNIHERPGESYYQYKETEYIYFKEEITVDQIWDIHPMVKKDCES